MKVYLVEVTNKLTEEKELAITTFLSKIAYELEEKNTKMGKFIKTQASDENLEIKVLEEHSNFHNLFVKAIGDKKQHLHGRTEIEFEKLIIFMKEFGFKLDGKQRITNTDLYAFCEFLFQTKNISTNRGIIKDQFQERNRLGERRVAGKFFYEMI